MIADLEDHLGAPDGYSNSHLVDQLFDAAADVSPEFVMDVYHAFAPSRGFNTGYAAACSAGRMAERDPLAALRLIKMLREANIPDMNSVYLLPIIDALGKKDPAAALTLAKAYPDNYLAPETLLAAAAFQPKAEAKAIVTAVFSEEKYRTVRTLAKVYAFDPDMAKALYARYKTQLEAEIRRIGENVTRDVQAYQQVSAAGSLSGIDPQFARLVIETEYAFLLNSARKVGYFGYLSIPVQAMCALDLQRAEQMAEAMKGHRDGEYGQYYGQPVMEYLLTSREAWENR